MKSRKKKPLLPWEENGLKYFTDPQTGERICTGAQMGRRCEFPDRAIHARLRLSEVRIESDGYDKGGAYWGFGIKLFCGFTDNPERVRVLKLFCGFTDNPERVRVYVRAVSRQAAKFQIQDKLPNVTFAPTRHD